MLVYNIITAICLGLLIIQGVYMLINMFVKDRPEKISFIRGFKNGKCAMIYLTAIPLYWIGHVYAGNNALNSFFVAINKIVNLVVLKYDTSSIEKLMEDNGFYNNTVYFTFFLVGVNAVLFALSFSIQQMWCFSGWLKRRFTPNEILIIFGNNKSSIAIYRSDEKRNKQIFDTLSQKDMEHLYQENVYYSTCKTVDKKIKRIFKILKRTDKVHRIVINTESDDKNIRICRKFISAMKDYRGDTDKLFLKINIYVFGDPRYQALYNDILQSGFGCIKYLNKYQAVAMDFIDKYPLSLFMNGNQIDYSTALVKDDVEINVALVGFGKTSHQILLTSVANNQFLKKGEREPELKKVNYYIYDKKDAINDKNLNHSYYRYKYECSNLNESEYLPIPTIPAEEKPVQMDINDKDFYNSIRELFTRSKNDANFLIIGYGTDLENIDLAQKLVEKRREWELDNLVIFVKARAYHKEDTLISEGKCYFIGNENDIVYDIEKIISDDIDKMAKMRNDVYDLEYAIANENLDPTDEKSVKEITEKSQKKWHTKTQQERDSSLYACLSLRSKLNLIGLDYKKKENDKDKDGLSREKYLEKYAKDDKIDFETYKNVTANEKPIIKYTLDFKDTLRKTFAIHEHQRWNSFMISQGTVPSSLYEIFFETKDNGNKLTNGKSYISRRHGNLTTFEGLVQFRRLIANRNAIIDPVVKRLAKEQGIKEEDVKLDKRPLIEPYLENDAYKSFMDKPSAYEEQADVIKYDYQLMDDAYWLLSKTGYKIIEKQEITD